MAKLADYVRLAGQTDTCAVLEVTEVDTVKLLLTGVLNGDEKYIRVAKLFGTTVFTVIRRDGSHVSWVKTCTEAPAMMAKEKLILDCLEETYEIKF